VKLGLTIAGTLMIFAISGVKESAPQAKAPRFLSYSEIALPENYREWIFVSSGLGMSYGPPDQARSDTPRFDNVFVTPDAYRAFLKTGTWPNGTMFVLEVRRSKGNESINNSGRFQDELVSVEAEVKDETRFPTKWGFFTFPNGAKTGQLLPTATTECQSCHSQHGAVDNTFVQFYPTLLEVAKKKGTLKSKY
jgi:hypothetical protein